MKAAIFNYQRPPSLNAALQAVSSEGNSAKLMGGSQSLGPMLNLRLARPKQVLDVSALPELRTVTQHGRFIRIGAAVTHAEIEDGLHVPLRGGILQSVAAGIASRAIRNRGTIGGSLAHADPAADWVLTMTALAAEMEIISIKGARRVPMAQFMQGAYTTVLADGEILSAVWVPQMNESVRWGYSKVCRKVGEFAEASCAAVFDSERGFARIVLGALDGAPKALPDLAAQVARSASLPPVDLIAATVCDAVLGKNGIERRSIVAAVERCLVQIFPRK